jgi:uncharacterized OB-fold protein
MSARETRDAGYDDLLDAVAAGDPYYLACPDGHGALPPRRACPECGDTALTEAPLETTGTVRTHTTVRVATPTFAAETPYVTAIASFGPVSLTGVVRGVAPDGVEAGLAVDLSVGETAGGERILVFEV